MDRDTAIHAAYCLQFLQIGDLIADQYPNDQVAVVHDRSSSRRVIRAALDLVKSDPRFKDVFTSLEFSGWETEIPLQPADYCAFHGFRFIRERVGDNPKPGKYFNRLRRAGLGRFFAEWMEAEHYQQIMQIAENRRNNRPRAEGVTTKLKLAC